MPEYSTPNLTPSGTSKVPGMNGSSSGYFEVDDILDIIRTTFGAANGVATLGSDGKLTGSQLPDLADDVIVVASPSNLPATGEDGKLYIVKSGSAGNNLMYRWDTTAEDYVQLSVDLSDYETKAEANDLKNAIDKNTARIENLEQKAGDYSTVQYRGTNAVPTGKAKNALVENIVGKTRAWNQLAPNISALNYVALSNTSASFSNNTITFTTAQNYGGARSNDSNKLKVNAGHKYFVSFYANMNANLHVGTGNGYFGIIAPTSTITQVGSKYLWQGFCDVQASEDSYLYIWDTRESGWTEVVIDTIIIRDLTLIFPEGVPATVAECVQKCPDLLKYDDYNTGSLVSTTVEGVESIGCNIIDSIFEDGGFDADGAESAIANWKRTKNYAKCSPSTAYYFKQTGTASYATVVFYDASQNVVEIKSGSGGGIADGASFTTPSTASYLRMAMATSYGDIGKFQVCLNSLTDKTTFHEYMTDTLSLSNPVPLRSAGYGATEVAEVLTLDTGKKTRPIKELTFDADTDWQESSGVYYLSLSDGKVYSVNLDPSITFSDYEIVGTRGVVSFADKTCSIVAGTSAFAIRDDSYANLSAFKAGMVGKKLTYALATPLADEQVCDPIIDNYIATEGGGTINTKQTQTTKIDNCMDVGYLAL